MSVSNPVKFNARRTQAVLLRVLMINPDVIANGYTTPKFIESLLLPRVIKKLFALLTSEGQVPLQEIGYSDELAHVRAIVADAMERDDASRTVKKPKQAAPKPKKAKIPPKPKNAKNQAVLTKAQVAKLQALKESRSDRRAKVRRPATSEEVKVLKQAAWKRAKTQKKDDLFREERKKQIDFYNNNHAEWLKSRKAYWKEIRNEKELRKQNPISDE